MSDLIKRHSRLCLILLLSWSVIFIACNKNELEGSLSTLECEDTNCADYNSRWEAQMDFDWNPACRADLDADNDGLACEENRWTDYYNTLSDPGNGGSNSGCPTTANCGCSNKLKAVCEGDICCRWIVGTGCR